MENNTNPFITDITERDYIDGNVNFSQSEGLGSIDNANSIYQNELEKLQSNQFGTQSSGSKRLSFEEIAARKQERLAKKQENLVEDDSNFLLKAKELYNSVNDLWDGKDLKANYMGKQHSMSNKSFEDVNATMQESEQRRQELIDQYNSAEDDPNSKHKVYNLRLLDGYDQDGKPIYNYKVGIAESSAADRYKNQWIKNGYEIVSEKGFAGAEDWENKWHGLKSNLENRVFDEGINSSGQKISDISGFGDGYSEIYNQNFLGGDESAETLKANMEKSQAIRDSVAEQRRQGYGRGSDSIIDATQAGAARLGLETADFFLDVLTPGDNTWLNEEKEQSNIDKYVGYNRKTADKAIGEATNYFKQGKYVDAMWEVLKEPQIVAESIPEMVSYFAVAGWATKVVKLGNAIKKAYKVGDIAKSRKLQLELANDITASQRLMHKVASNAGFLTAVGRDTNMQIDDRIQNKIEAGEDPNVGALEVAGMFASNLALLGTDKIAFTKITGFGKEGKAALASAFSTADLNGKKKVLANMFKTAGSLTAAGAGEAAQEYVQTWGEIVNTELGVDNKTFMDVINNKENQDEAIGGMLAGFAGGAHMRGTSDALESVYNKASGKESRLQMEAEKNADIEELKNVENGIRTADSFDPVANTEDRIKASKRTVDAINRQGSSKLATQMLYGGEVVMPDGSINKSNDASETITKYIKALDSELKDSTTSGGVNPVTAKLKFEESVARLINDSIDKLNSSTYNINTAKAMLENKLGKDEYSKLSEEEIQKKIKQHINNEKLKLGTAIGNLAADPNNGMNEKLLQGIMAKFRKRYVDDKLEEIYKENSLKPDSGKIDTESFKESIFGKQDINKSKEPDVDSDVESESKIDLKIKEDQYNELLNNIDMLYSMGGKNDNYLKEMLNDFTNATVGEDGIRELTIDKKKTYNVANDIINRGFTGKDDRVGLKSITDHQTDLVETAMNGFDEINSGKLNKSKEKNRLQTLIKDAGKFVTFSGSRRFGLEDYFLSGNPSEKEIHDARRKVIDDDLDIENIQLDEISKFDLNQFKSNSNVEFNELLIDEYKKLYSEFLDGKYDKDKTEIISKISELSKAIIVSKGGKEEIRKGDMQYLTDRNQRIADDERLPDDKKRKFKPTISRPGLIAAYNYESKEIIYGLKRSRDALISYRDALISNGMDSNQKEISDLNSMIETINREIKATNFHNKLFKELYLNTGEKRSIVDDQKKIAELLVKEADEIKKGKQDKYKKKLQEIDDRENIDKENKEESSKEAIKDNKESSTVEPEVVESDVISDEESFKMLKDLYNEYLEKGSIEGIIESTTNNESGYHRNEDGTAEIYYVKDDKGNVVVKSHELFHHISYEYLDGEMTKADIELVEQFKNMFNEKKNEIIAYYEKLVTKDDMTRRDLKNLIAYSEQDGKIFQKELSAVLYSNSNARRYLINKLVDYNESGKKAKGIKDVLASYIRKIFKAYQNVIDVLSKMKDNDVKLYSDIANKKEYKQVLELLGRSIRRKTKKESNKKSNNKTKESNVGKESLSEKTEKDSNIDINEVKEKFNEIDINILTDSDSMNIFKSINKLKSSSKFTEEELKGFEDIIDTIKDISENCGK